MTSQRRPNRRLRVLLADSAWSGQDLAAAVNHIGRESGLTTQYDRTAVAHWLTGTTPRMPVPALIAEAFSRRLGRTVTAAQAGFDSPAETGGSAGRSHRAEAAAAGDNDAAGDALAVAAVAHRSRASGRPG